MFAGADRSAWFGGMKQLTLAPAGFERYAKTTRQTVFHSTNNDAANPTLSLAAAISMAHIYSQILFRPSLDARLAARGDLNTSFRLHVSFDRRVSHLLLQSPLLARSASPRCFRI
jgi:hypothetical protein